MHADRFDAVVRNLVARPSRRSLLRIVLGGMFGGVTLAATEAKKRHKKKKRKRHGCTANCDGRRCGGDGCGGSCGTCAGDKVCKSGTCDCPDGTEKCGGACLPLCHSEFVGAQVVRHPATCQCCLRPNYLSCGGGERQECCGEPESIPCCGQPCDPIAANQDCVEIQGACHYDVECAAGRRCLGDIDPRTCEDIPTG
jgi:hypothetical protein